NVVLRIKSSIASIRPIRVRSFGIETESSAGAPRADLGKLGIFFYFNPPTVIVGQMPMKRVQLVQRHGVQHGLDFCFVKKMATHIEQNSPPFETRPVLDLNAGNLPVDILNTIGRENLRREQLK